MAPDTGSVSSAVAAGSAVDSVLGARGGGGRASWDLARDRQWDTPQTPTALRRLRWRLTAWYVGTFALILFLLGSALFAAIAHQIAAELEASLRAATRAIAQATAIREVEAVSAKGTAVDAVTELTIPGRSLYLFDSTGAPLTPPTADSPIVAAAHRAVVTGQANRHFKDHRHGQAERDFQVHAERFVVRSGHRYVAAAVADRVELEDRYASLIAALAGGAAGALLLIAGGGWFLAGKSTAPIERSMLHMRHFMADAAHELRTPVAVLRSRAEVALQRERDPAAYAAVLKAVGVEAERIGGIVEDLLTLARADAGERPLARDRVYLDDVAVEAVDGVRILAERRGVDLAVPEFEEAVVEADPVLLRQLIVIILDNAIKFTPAGGRVSLRVRAEGARPSVVVEDSGVGIAPAERAHIFDRFYRGGNARAQGDGAGLGLSIARWIADGHGATIEVESALGAGTRVTIRFAAPASRS